MTPESCPPGAPETLPSRIRAAFQVLDHIRNVRYVEFYTRGADSSIREAGEHELSGEEQSAYLTALDAICQYIDGALPLDAPLLGLTAHNTNSDNARGDAPVHV